MLLVVSSLLAKCTGSDVTTGKEGGQGGRDVEEQRWLSPPHRPAPALLAGSCSPVPGSGQTASPLLRTATGMVTRMFHDLLLIVVRSWAEADGYFLPKPSMREQRALAGS